MEERLALKSMDRIGIICSNLLTGPRREGEENFDELGRYKGVVGKSVGWWEVVDCAS